ncbi:hypothetical protein [Lacipirellula parvula]|uniref:Uncharacterized protein n=1 Tax=Lacipirellula parvula TaxID=2650471 RepID=A0A5K7X7W8_9BACT|nr:hypothetical protein [Lacipirellula parvula]BBO30553.1 hypothetical protein PLANPX_0165 [Lacipirellula parvula]
MRTILVLLKYVAAALLAMVIVGGAGMMLGSIVARSINPHPNPHLYEGLEYVMGGALIGALLGLVGVIVAAIRATRAKRQRSNNSESAS